MSDYPTHPRNDFGDTSPARLESHLSSSPAPHIELRWQDLTVTAPKRDRPILASLNGSARSGECLAVMGPSGAGKSTFLDAICQRTPRAKGLVTVNGSTDYSTRDLFSFVEQDDALLGVLTVRETVAFAAYLALGPSYPNIDQHIDATLTSLGLSAIAGNRIGTPLQRGISGGQKRRVTIACSVVAKPRILVLDEPTSGLDSTSGREVVAFLQHLAREQGVLIICTIHQPNFETFALFDRLLLLAGGQTMYDGRVDDLDNYLASVGSPTPAHVNPADHAIELVNTEFRSGDKGDDNYPPTGDFASPAEHLQSRADLWTNYKAKNLAGSKSTSVEELDAHALGRKRSTASQSFVTNMRKTITLSHRAALNYSRNVLAYGIRLGMYCGMGLLLATVWIRLGWTTDKLNDRLSVSFFSVAFLGFMSVAGIPSFLEERAVFIRERANGLYSPAQYLLATTLVSLPFLFVCAAAFTLIIYWAIGMNPGATHFFRFLLYLYLGLVAAESQSLLVAAAIPIFVAALAIAAFANGLWMCVQGYFIRATSLPKFWYYWAHFIDYETFAFELLVRNDFVGRILTCPKGPDGSCLCPIPSSLTPGQCAVSGEDVIQNLGYGGVSDGLYVGILIIIIFVYRLLMWGVLVWRKR
ncbi:hypothetical protein JCM10049v2_001551 [Rhodotorula toruloides]